jgi:hypothetical protein
MYGDRGEWALPFVQDCPGPPLGRTYVREIAGQYGISYDQLIALLRQRGMVE